MVNCELKSAALSDTVGSAVRCSIQLVLLAVTVCLVYANTLDNQFVFDDSRIYNNPYIRITSLDWDSLRQVVLHSEPATRPVANLSFAFNYYLHGYQVGGYHLINLLIHVLNGVLLYFLALEIFRTPVFQQWLDRNGKGGFSREWTAFFAALLWLVHPIQTQSVTYVIQRMNSLATLFYIASLLFYIRGRSQPAVKLRCFFWGASFLSGVLAMGSKEISITLPLFILLYEWYFFQDMDRGWLRRQFLPLAIVAGGVLVVALFFSGGHPLQFIQSTYDSRSFTLSERLMTEPRVLFFYITLLLFPHPARLNLDHDFLLSTSMLEPYSTLPAAAGVIGLFGAVILFARKNRLLSFALFWFLGNLVIESSVLGLELVFEHRLYLPSMMLFLVFAVAVERVVSERFRRVVLMVCLAALLSFWTVERNKVWQDKITLWSDCVIKSPGKARPHNNLGVALKEHGRLAEAAAHYKKVIEIDPQFLEAYNNLGNVLSKMGQWDEALDYYSKALEIAPNHPLIHNNIGRLLMDMKRYDRALMHFSEALRLKPDFQEARINMQSARWMWKLGVNSKQ
jgi:hypothetical protein